MFSNTAILKKSLASALSLSLVIGFVPLGSRAFAATASQSIQSLQQASDMARKDLDKSSSELEKAKTALSNAEKELAGAQEERGSTQKGMQSAQDSLSTAMASALSKARSSKSDRAQSLSVASKEYDSLISQSGGSYDTGDIESISKQIAEKDSALSVARADKENLQSEKTSVCQSIDKCADNIASLLNDIAGIESEIEELQWEKASSEMDAAQRELDPVKNSFEAARTRKAEASAEVSRYTDQTGRLYADWLAADHKTRDAKEAMESSQKAYNDYRDSNGLTGEQKVISLKEYLTYKGATDALGEFDYRQGYTGEAKEVTDATRSETMNDATDYRNVLRALDTIRKTNEVRKSLGLSELLVSDRLMAKEAVSTNWSATNITHSDGCGSENLDWGKGGANGNPVEIWYDWEKAIYDKAVETNMYEDQQLPSNWQEIPLGQLGQMGYYMFTLNVGHYLNLITPEHLYVGAAVNNMPGTYKGTVWGQLYSSGSLYSDAVPVDQWEEEFLAWVDTQLVTRPDVALFAQYEQACQEHESAKARADAIVLLQAENNELLAAAREDSVSANAAYKEIAPIYDEALAKYQPVKDAYDAVKAQYDPLAEELSVLSESLSAHNNERTRLEHRVSELDSRIASCDDDISRIRSELDALRAESATAYTIAEKAREVSAAQAAYDKASTELAYITSFDAEGALAGNGKKVTMDAFASLNADITACAAKTATYKRACERYDTALATRDAARSRLATAQAAYDKALASYNAAKSAYDAAVQKEASRASIAGATVTLSSNALTYTGSALTAPTVKKVVCGGKVLVSGRDYTVSRPSGCKKIGAYSVTVTGIGDYKGACSATFKVNPAGATISKLATSKKQVTVSLKKKKNSNIGGYKIRYSKSKSMPSSSTTTVSASKSATSKVVKSLPKNKTYYFQVRTYKKVSGVTYYSAWSTAKSVKVKG